jgi:DNA-binding beta-propeller fold protein YncE
MGSRLQLRRIFLPFGVAVDPAGNIFIADSSNNRIRRVDAASRLMSTVAGNGNAGDTGDGGPATMASLSLPTSVALDGAGNLYFADSNNHAIRMVTAATRMITTVAGVLGSQGYSGDGGARFTLT